MKPNTDVIQKVTGRLAKLHLLIINHNNLGGINAKDFARGVKENVLSSSEGAKVIKLHREPKAVLMSIETYDEIVAMIDDLEQLTKSLELDRIEALRKDFKALHGAAMSKHSAMIVAKTSKLSAKLFRENYRPGETETKR